MPAGPIMTASLKRISKLLPLPDAIRALIKTDMTWRKTMKHALGMFLLAWTFDAFAQEVNPIIGIWKRNDVESTAPGLPPKMEVREYRPGPDGYLIGLAVWIGTNGSPG